MYPKKSYGLWIGTALSMAAAAQAQTALLDDLEGGNSFNEFGGQWGFSGDFWDKGNSRILSAVDTSVAIPFFKGAYGEGYPDGAGNAAKLHFRFGTVKPGTPPNTYDNNVSMSSPFGPDDAVLNLTGAQSISFYAKSDKAMQVEVVLATADITDYAYYTAMIATTAAWAKYTVKLAAGAGGLTRRPFGVNKPLDLAQATAITWEVNKGRNGAITEATLWVDDVNIQGYAFTAPEPRGSCVVNGCIVTAGAIPKPSALVADFDHGDPSLNSLGMPWNYGSAMPMGDARPSVLTAGIDSANFRLDPAGRGYAGSNGGMIGFTLGDNWFTPEGYIQLPAVNLMTQLAAGSALDATGATGIYFDYKTTGEVEYVDLKLPTDQVHNDNTYAIAFVKLKATGGNWKGAHVKWSDFILPNWGAPFREAEKAMRFTGLMGMEWSVTSARKNVQGSLSLDNIHLTGIEALPNPASLFGNRRAARTAAAVARLRRGVLEVPFLAPAGAHTGVVRVLDMEGRELSLKAFRTRVAGGDAATHGGKLRFGLETPMRRGIYLVRVESAYGDGRKFSALYPAILME
jgi:hypothetical protein